MRPIKFTGYERVLAEPVDWDPKKQGECVGLPVTSVGDATLSVWKLTLLERLKLLFGFKLVVSVVAGGRTQPPIGFDVLRVEEIEKDKPAC